MKWKVAFISGETSIMPTESLIINLQEFDDEILKIERLNH